MNIFLDFVTTIILYVSKLSRGRNKYVGVRLDSLFIRFLFEEIKYLIFSFLQQCVLTLCLPYYIQEAEIKSKLIFRFFLFSRYLLQE